MNLREDLCLVTRHFVVDKSGSMASHRGTRLRALSGRSWMTKGKQGGRHGLRIGIWSIRACNESRVAQTSQWLGKASR